jgi:curli biogenesis system outer membrane secretion channel CsgG/pSer/pThr/pTyr-binding forkhead associated (FHA) protein/SH3-like domain-containing protein
MRIEIDALSGFRGGESETFDTDVITLGRDTSNSFSFPWEEEATLRTRSESAAGSSDVNSAERFVSTHHARIVVKSNRVYIEDLNSTNGTYVAGEKVVGERVLRPGAEISLGKRGPKLRIRYRGNETVAEIRGTVAETSPIIDIAAARAAAPPHVAPAEPVADGKQLVQSRVGSSTVMRLIDQAMLRASEGNRLARPTLFAQEIVRAAVRQSRKELKIVAGAIVMVIAGVAGFLLYRIAEVRSEVRSIKADVVSEYQKGLDGMSAKLAADAKDLDQRRHLYESTASDLRAEMGRIAGAQGQQSTTIQSLLSDLDQSRSRYTQLVHDLQEVRLQNGSAGDPTLPANGQKLKQLSESIHGEQVKQDQLVQKLGETAPKSAAARAIEQLAQLGAQMRAADGAAAQLGATASHVQNEQATLSAGKKEDAASLQQALKSDDSGAEAVLDRISKLEKASAPAANTPAPVAAIAPASLPVEHAPKSASVLYSRPYPRASLKKRLALGKFECLVASNPWNLSREDVEKQMRAQMTTLLRDSGKFVIVEREDLGEVLQEQRLGQTGVTTGQSSSQSGQLLGVQAIIVGKITQLQEEVQESKSSFNWGAMLSSVASVANAYSPSTQFAQTATQLSNDPSLGTLKTSTERRNSKFTIHIDFKILDTNTGEVLFTTQGHGVATTQEKHTAVGTQYVQGASGLLKGNDSLADGTRQALYDATMKIMEGMESRPWQGRIMDRSGDHVVLNAGDDAGLKEGDTFQVLSRGKELIDPDSGRSRGHIQTPAGTVRVTSVSGPKSEADVVDLALPFKPGDDLVYVGTTRALKAGENAAANEERIPFSYGLISTPKAFTGPGVNYGEVDVKELEGGSPVKVKVALGDWVKIVLPAGSTAWMPKEGVTIRQDFPTNVKQVVVAVNKAALRQAPSNRSRKVDVLRQGMVSDVQEKLGSWYLVKAMRGNSGWVSESEVRANDAPPPAPVTQAGA